MGKWPKRRKRRVRIERKIERASFPGIVVIYVFGKIHELAENALEELLFQIRSGFIQFPRLFHGENTAQIIARSALREA